MIAISAELEWSAESHAHNILSLITRPRGHTARTWSPALACVLLQECAAPTNQWKAKEAPGVEGGEAKKVCPRLRDPCQGACQDPNDQLSPVPG
jgi:hypothetical protein